MKLKFGDRIGRFVYTGYRAMDGVPCRICGKRLEKGYDFTCEIDQSAFEVGSSCMKKKSTREYMEWLR